MTAAQLLPPRPSSNAAPSSEPHPTPPPRALPPPRESGTRIIARAKPAAIPQSPPRQPIRFEVSELPLASVPPAELTASWFPEPAEAKPALVMPEMPVLDLTVDDDELERLAKDTQRRKRRRLLVACSFPLVIAGVLFSLSGGGVVEEPARPMLEAAINAGTTVEGNIKREAQQLADLEKELEQKARLAEEQAKTDLKNKLRRRALTKRR